MKFNPSPTKLVRVLDKDGHVTKVVPKIGEIRAGYEIGYGYSNKFIWGACEVCGKERWVGLIRGHPHHRRCNPCANREAGKGHSRNRSSWWKGGRILDHRGYIYISLESGDFFYPMTNKQGYVFEHRLVMAKHLGRCLHSWELVHHKNHVRDDNRIENLQLVTDDRHNQITILENKISNQAKEIAQLKKQMCLLNRAQRRKLKVRRHK